MEIVDILSETETNLGLSQWQIYMKNLQKYAQSQSKIYESHPVSKENPINPIISIENEETDENNDIDIDQLNGLL